jgi:hypothetical protein
MIKLNILDMDNFLQTVNACSDAVNLLYPDGRKENINKHYGLQNELLHQYRKIKTSCVFHWIFRLQRII